MSNVKEGSLGEDFAYDFLVKKGFVPVERNYRSGKGEIDIIMREGELLVFIEVKLRKTDQFGPPECSITIRKQRQIKRTALAYLTEKNIRNVQCRFDVIGITQNKETGMKINHIENAFIV